MFAALAIKIASSDNQRTEKVTQSYQLVLVHLCYTALTGLLALIIVVITAILRKRKHSKTFQPNLNSYFLLFLFLRFKCFSLQLTNYFR